MTVDKEIIWSDSTLIFDSSSIVRLYEWHKNKSLELKDIFDFKTHDIVLLEQVKKEVLYVTQERLENKKNKYSQAFEELKISNNKTRVLQSLQKQNDGNKFSEEFYQIAEKYVDGVIEEEQVNEFIDIYDRVDNHNIDENDINCLIKNFFSREYSSKITEECLEQMYNNDLGLNLPGYKDKNKDTNKFGDYTIINQLVELANDSNMNLTFVTADVKPDWFPFDSKTNSRAVNKNLQNWFESKIINSSTINIITLSELLQIARNYISDDLKDLVDEQIILSLVKEKYETWYPDDLMEIVTKYIEENADLQNEIEDAIDSCLDYISFGESESCKIINIDYEIEDNCVQVNINAEFYLSLDTAAHCAGEDFELGSPSCTFFGQVLGEIPIQWSSEYTDAISLGSQLEDIVVVSIDLLSVSSLYKPDYEEPDYEEADYEEADYEEPDYEEPDYEEPDYDEPDYDESDYDESVN